VTLLKLNNDINISNEHVTDLKMFVFSKITILLKLYDMFYLIIF